MSQTIIQLSEKNSPDNVNRDNGDYEIVLKGDPVVIRDGARIDLKYVFIDSVESDEGKIVVEEDITDGFVEVVPYIFNWTTENKNYNEQGAGNDVQLQNQPDGKAYFASAPIKVKNVAYRSYNSICVACQDQDKGPMKTCNIKIGYKRNDGLDDTFTIPIRGGDNLAYFQELGGRSDL